jgi:hypothetical protein
VKATADKVVEAVRRLGNNARDLRDAAHEACHAIDGRVPHGKWKRDTIHQYLNKRKVLGVSGLVYYEVRARAVEKLVCEHFDVAYEVEEWVNVACLEAAGYGFMLKPSWLTEQVCSASTRDKVKDMVAQILKLGESS